MTTLYRVEHPESEKGPYCIDFAEDLGEVEEEIILEMADYHGNSGEHHSMGNDWPLSLWGGIDADFYCAFDSFDKLMWWFDGYIDYLLNMGYQILSIQVPDNDIVNSKSGKQTFFTKDHIFSSEVLF